jgi:hypothetical protein
MIVIAWEKKTLILLQAREQLFDDSNWEHEYPSSHLGEAEFRDTSARLLFGEQSNVLAENR